MKRAPAAGAEGARTLGKLRERAILWVPLVALASSELFAALKRAPDGFERTRLFLGATLEVSGAASAAMVALGAFLAFKGPRAAAGSRTARWALASVLLPLAIVAARSLLLVLFQRFHNRELAALVGAVALLALGELARRSFDALLPLVARWVPARAPWLALVPAGLVGAGFAFWAARGSGLAQLDPWLLLVPALGLGSFWLARRANPELTVPVPTLARFALSGLALAAVGNAVSPGAVSWLARYGVWSRPTVAVLRALSDVDGDGASAWFGGGDCAPFDASVHPGATEIPRDGIDNNCRGGDGGGSPPAPPKPSRLVPATVPRRPNLVLVTIETLRADHVSLLGYERRTTPELERLAAKSFVFEQSYATTPTTRLSLVALLSGRLPAAVRWIPQDPARQMRRIAPETPWLPEILARRGYATLAVHTDFRAFTQVENAGFERGFERYDTSTTLSYSGGTMRGFPGEAQVERALALLDELAPRPFFLWVHLVEPHYLYEQSKRAPSFGVDERSLYDADIAEADLDVGRLAQGLERRGLLESTVLLVTGDHGEEFGEHGQRWHGNNLYEAQVRTATLLRVPGFEARRIADAVSFIDLAPTLLDLLGIGDAFASMMGRNLVPVLAGRDPPKPVISLENFRVDNGQEALFARLEPPHKLIYDATLRSYELYDLSRDAGERRNLYAAEDPLSKRLADALQRHLENDVAPGAVPR